MNLLNWRARNVRAIHGQRADVRTSATQRDEVTKSYEVSGSHAQFIGQRELSGKARVEGN